MESTTSGICTASTRTPRTLNDARGMSAKEVVIKSIRGSYYFLINGHQGLVVGFRGVLLLINLASRPSHSSNSLRIVPRPLHGIRQFTGVSRRKMQSTPVIVDDFLHPSQA